MIRSVNDAGLPRYLLCHNNTHVINACTSLWGFISNLQHTNWLLWQQHQNLELWW